MNDKPNKQQNRQMLTQLHDQLAQAQSEGVDENDQAILRHLMSDIQEMLNQVEQDSATSDPANPSVLERMETGITKLEITHPTLSSMIRKAIDTLDIAGI